MTPAGNKAKRLSSANHTTRTIHHHHHQTKTKSSSAVKVIERSNHSFLLSINESPFSDICTIMELIV